MINLTDGTITLTIDDPSVANVYGPTAFVIDGATITIDGSGHPGLVLSGGGAMRLFAVTSTGSLTLEDLTVTGGLAQGGAGGISRWGGSGGGAAGLGGAVYDDDGSFTAQGVTFTNNTAQGGAGGSLSEFDDGTGGRRWRPRRFGPEHRTGRAFRRWSRRQEAPAGSAAAAAAETVRVPRRARAGRWLAVSVAAAAAAAAGDVVPGGSGGFGGGSRRRVALTTAVAAAVAQVWAAPSSATAAPSRSSTTPSPPTRPSAGPAGAAAWTAAMASGYGGAVFVRNGTLGATFDTFSGDTVTNGDDSAGSASEVYVLGDGNGSAYAATLIDDILGQSGDSTVSDFVAATFNGGTAPDLSASSNDLVTNNPDGTGLTGTGHHRRRSRSSRAWPPTAGRPRPWPCRPAARPSAPASRPTSPAPTPTITTDQSGAALNSPPDLGALQYVPSITPTVTISTGTLDLGTTTDGDRRLDRELHRQRLEPHRRHPHRRAHRRGALRRRRHDLAHQPRPDRDPAARSTRPRSTPASRLGLRREHQRQHHQHQHRRHRAGRRASAARSTRCPRHHQHRHV